MGEGWGEGESFDGVVYFWRSAVLREPQDGIVVVVGLGAIVVC